MNIFQVFQSLAPSNFQNEHLVLRHGQIVNATLLDMFPNGDAKISFQGHIVRAKIETPLAKGEHTFMQVKSFNDGTVTMQMITKSEKKASTAQVPTSNINDLLRSINLPQNAAWREIAQQLITRNIPLLPEILQNGIEVLGKEPNHEQQQTWITMLERGLPINLATFQAVDQILYGQPIGMLIRDFYQLSNQFINDREALLPNTQHKQGNQHLQVDNLLSSTTPSETIDTSIAQGSGHSNQMNSPTILTNNYNLEAGMKALQDTHNHELTTNRSQTSQNQELVLDLRRLNKVFEMLADNTTQLSSSTRPPVITDNNILVTILKLIGYNHESKVHSLFQDFHQAQNKTLDPITMKQAETMKQLLLQVSNNDNYPTAIRSMATQLLNNVNGQQLLSLPQDSNSQFQNTMIQIPMTWSENQQDTLTLQIQGKKEKRTIDPDNCSIYIELNPPNLGELGIFVRVTNKVVSVRLLSQNKQLKELTQQTEGLLKQGLAEQGYNLSYIKVEAIEPKENRKLNLKNYGKSPQTGFDIRI